MCKKKICCLTTWIAFLVIGIILLIFSIVIIPSLINSVAKDGALMLKTSEELWAHIPGKSGVNIFQEFFFYSIKNIESVVFSNDKVTADEKGPFIAEEITDFININYSQDNNKVGFNLFRYFNATNEELKRQENTVLDMVNVVSLGVWHQAKWASKSTIALKAFYTIYQGLTNDLYYTAAVTAIKQGLGETVFNQFNYYPPEKVRKLFDDEEYGLYRTNFKFMKAILNHPCKESEILMNYFDLAFHEMELLRTKLYSNANNLIFNGRNQTTMGFTQWLNLGINFNQSIYQEYSPEYAYFLKISNKKSSNLTIQQVSRLFAINDFNSSLPKVDDSASFLNKYNLDKIFEFEDIEESVDFINEKLEISNLDEARSLREYIDYVSGDMAFRFSKGGTRGIGAIADFLSQGFQQLFDTMGNDLYYGILENKLANGLFKNLSCENFTKNFIFDDIALKDLITDRSEKINKSICENPKLRIDYLNNTRFWIENIVEKNLIIKNILELNDLEFDLLTRENSLLVKKFTEYINQLMTENNILNGNYKFFDRKKIAANQWSSGNVTNITNSTISVKDWRNDHYKNKPEFANFCKNFYPDKCGEISSDEILKILNTENLFNSQYITNIFIEYYNNKETKNKFAQRFFIDYMRYFMVYEVLNLFTKKTAKDMMWGYKDDFLETVKNTNYFIGGDPTIEPIFSFLNNMTSLPEKENVWEFYTGNNDSKLIRKYKSVMGYDKTKIILREKYFDGKTIKNGRFRNPWKNLTDLEGTDAIAFAPQMDEHNRPSVYLDQLCRSGSFIFRKRLNHLNLDLLRYTIDKNLIQNSTLNPENDNFYSYKYNGFGNVTSVFKAPFYASKPYYFQCDNSEQEQPIINRAEYPHKNTTDPDDIDLFEESFVDIEPYSGAVIRAGQKILVSALLQNDELFEIKNDKFIPVYYVFRNGNFTQNSVDEVFKDLFTAFILKKILMIIAIFIVIFTLALVIYFALSIHREKNRSDPLLL